MTLELVTENKGTRKSVADLMDILKRDNPSCFVCVYIDPKDRGMVVSFWAEPPYDKATQFGLLVKAAFALNEV